jgi:hypothetical protein
MTDRRYTLGEVTGVMGQALAAVRANPTSSQSVERALDLYGQGIIDRLKALPEPGPALWRIGEDGRQHPVARVLTADENAARYGYVSPND